MPRFATICHYMLPRRDLSSDLFSAIVQKYLTTAGLLLYNRRRAFAKFIPGLAQIVLDFARLCTYTTRAGTGSVEDLHTKLFLPKVQKVLDKFAQVLYYWRVRTEDLLNKK